MECVCGYKMKTHAFLILLFYKMSTQIPQELKCTLCSGRVIRHLTCPDSHPFCYDCILVRIYDNDPYCPVCSADLRCNLSICENLIDIPPSLVDMDGHYPSTIACDYCLRSDNLKACDACGKTFYCDAICQTGDWDMHKKWCSREEQEKEEIIR